VKRRRGGDIILVIVLCVIGAALGRLQSQSREKGSLDPVSSVIAKTVNPATKVVDTVADATRDFLSGIFSVRSLRAENRRLKSEQLATALYQEKVEALQREIDELRKLNGLDSTPGRQKISADVIGYVPRENRITLSIGSSRGVIPGLAVVCPEGVVGVVSTVAPASCQVSLLGSANLIVGAMTQRNPPSVGLLQGAGANTTYIDFNDPKAEVKAGDLIMTSGFSEKIPRGLILGRVLSVEDNPELGQRRANVFPSVNLGSIREVFVLR